MNKAEEHWAWLEKVLHMVYVDAFNHGYKHGVEEENRRNKEEIFFAPAWEMTPTNARDSS